jgi:uncharacterized membrane protein
VPWVLALAVLCVGGWLGLRWASWQRSRAGRRSQRIGREGERVALRLLKRRGFSVLETEVAGWMRLTVDGRPQQFEVRADALVERKRKRYIAEFKAGEAGSRVEHRGTRRQLIEYALAYEVDGVLLVDAQRERIVAVELP